MRNEVAIRVEGLGKQFSRYETKRPETLRHLFKGLGRGRARKFWALRDVDLEVRAGEMVGVIGHNGSGKSTLLRLLGGVMRPDEGRVQVDGRIGGLLQLGVGFHPDLSGRENVFTSAIIAGLTRREVARRFDSIVEFAELEDHIDNPLRTFSTGMRMRLGFATAVHTDPDLLLIDEVLTVGDLGFQQKCLDRIERYKAEGCAVVYVSHSLGDVTEHCERVLWLRKGEAVACGPSELVAERYAAEMQAETRRRTPDGGPTRAGLVLNENRFGSLEMEIEGVRLLAPDGSELDEVAPSDPLSVELRYHAPRPVDSPVFSVAIANAEDVTCCNVNSNGGGLVLPRLHGRGRVVLHLGRLDLVGGAYSVSVGAYEQGWSHAYDYHWKAYPLRVASDRSDDGVLSPPRRWELVTGT